MQNGGSLRAIGAVPYSDRVRLAALAMAKFTIVYVSIVTFGPLVVDALTVFFRDQIALPGAFSGRSLAVVELALFAGAVVSGLAGFAFSAVAGAVLFLWIEPKDAVPVLLASSIATQAVSISKLWHSMQWRRCLPFIAGGLVGIPIGATLLLQFNPAIFVAVFGAFLVGYGALMLAKSRCAISYNGRFADPFVGFVGGITGGSAAFPGAIPTIWCNMQGLPKDAQRGLVQPFILAMQIFTLVYFSKVGLFTPTAIGLSLLCCPVVIAGTCLGIHLFKHLKDDTFRKVVLFLLILSGFGLMAKGL